MMAKAGNRRELRVVEIEESKFIVIFNFLPLDINSDKSFQYWMVDCMWPELENLVRRSSTRLAGKTSIDHKTLMKLAKSEESANFIIKVTYIPDLDNSLRDALDIDDTSELFSEINIKAEVTFKGDKIKLKMALDKLQEFNDPENIRRPKLSRPRTPTQKRPLQQLQIPYEGVPSSHIVDSGSDVECLTPKRIELCDPPAKAKPEASNSQEEKRKHKDDSREETKKIKTSREDKTGSKVSRVEKKSSKPNLLAKKNNKKLDKRQTTITGFFTSPAASKKSIEYLSQEEEESFEDVCALDKKSDLTDSQQDIFADIPPSERSPDKKASKPKETKKTDSFTFDSIFDSPLPPLTPQPSTSKFRFSSQSDTDSPSANLLRMIQSSPVKPNTPMRKHSKEEDIEIMDKFPDPDDAEFRRACKKFRKNLEKGNTQTLEPEVVKTMFDVHVGYLDALHQGEVHSLLREDYNKSGNNGSSMQYPDGALLFSYDNVNMLTDMVSERVHENKAAENANMNYTIKVLIPELVARFVMSAYKVSKEEALMKMRQISIIQSQKIFKF